MKPSISSINENFSFEVLVGNSFETEYYLCVIIPTLFTVVVSTETGFITNLIKLKLNLKSVNGLDVMTCSLFAICAYVLLKRLTVPAYACLLKSPIFSENYSWVNVYKMALFLDASI